MQDKRVCRECGDELDVNSFTVMRDGVALTLAVCIRCNAKGARKDHADEKRQRDMGLYGMSRSGRSR